MIMTIAAITMVATINLYQPKATVVAGNLRKVYCQLLPVCQCHHILTMSAIAIASYCKCHHILVFVTNMSLIANDIMF